VTLLLIDGNSLTYRAFFALPSDLATAGGQVTNAVFGFTSMLINLLRDHTPDGIVVAFDRPEPTFRHERVATYKGNRQETPDLLVQQFGLVRQVIGALNIPTVEAAGYEADDIIATLATQGRDKGRDVIVVTGDRDAYQLVEDPHIRVLYNRRGVSDYVLYDEAGIAERTGVKPADYVQYAALRGDTSDNLPGVPGVGEKTAAKLINSYGGLDGIFEHLDEQTPKLRQNLADHEAQARVNAELMVLLRDVPLDIGPDDLTWSPDFDVEEVRRLFDFLEFRTLYERLAEAVDTDLGAAPGGLEVIEAELTRWDDAAAAVAGLDALAARGGSSGDELAPVAVAAAWEGAPVRTALEGIALVTDPVGADVAWLPAELLGDGGVRQALGAALVGRRFAAHGAKPLMRELLRAGLAADGLHLDTQIAAYLVDPAEARYVLEELLGRYARLELPAGDTPPEGQLDLDGGTGVDVAQVTARQALAVDRLVEPINEVLVRDGLDTLNREIEVPLVGVLARMEDIGVGVDAGELRRLNEYLIEETRALTAAVHAAAGHEFNVNSTPQLREILFDQLGLTPTKKTKTGYSTDAASLEKLVGEHPIVEHLLRYREVEKLRSTYGEGLLAEVDPADGRIHATFNQTVARTGRLSSDAPNLHNIPVRSEEGRAFRKAFVPAEGRELLVADYNQIELRCIAHLAEDPGLIAAFEAGDDIHNATASRVFGVDPSEVTIEQRSKAKMVSYGLAYGMESYGLSQRLGIPVEEASEILNAYFSAFPAVKAYMEQTVQEARERGYTETLFGRRRPIPELLSDNYRIRQAGERQAMNAGIQGLAADIFKVALVRLDDELTAGGFASRLTLQVHDEVLLEVVLDEHDTMVSLVERVLCGAADLRVPLEVNLAFGANWADAKS
jgi:DNA polymerase-1